MKAMEVATFDRREPAEALKNRLKTGGLHAFVHDESWLQRFGFFTKPCATKQVEVPADEFDRAEHLVKELDAASDPVLSEAIRCPQCQSLRIEYPQYTRKFITPIIIELFVSMGLVPKEFYCLDCQYSWPKEIKREPTRDPLGWPVEKPNDH